MKKKLTVLMGCILTLVMVFALTGCGGSDSSDKKTLTIGCEATTPGWIAKKDDGKLKGFDYDMWQEIGKRTGHKIEFKVMDWDGMWTMLDDGRIDSVAEQISETPERAKKYNLSTPYAYNRYCLISRADNKALNSFEDIKDGMSISCESNTSDELIVNALEKKYGFKLKKTYYDGMSVTDVAMGRCDLWPRAETSSILTVKETKNLKILGKTDILETNVYPFADTDEGKALSEEVSKAIDEMREDGTIKKLSEKWFDQDISEKPEGAKTLMSYTN